ncbi:hypothetical protein K0C01_12400 [Salinarchaeum sp. IM2453]|uniref:hypothetical protein n=1 Tax=Salinarchaeum sp. IM2453 TaxID=2862870 RepID=UPI001C8282FC|nr:hypothetical protein [Salinarchaeum sp. IM2453]QZA88562.1 hypothetical protein K0C01_12400 [Salinarchaeum sp. IM2453]
MPHRSGIIHGVFAFFSTLFAIKIVVKKGLFLLDEIARHQFVHLPLEILLVEVPISVFGGVGDIVTDFISTELPAEAIGLVIAYPLFVALVVGVTHTASLRTIGNYWLGSTVITGLVVAMSIGMISDPGDVGSGITYHLQNHTIALVVQDIVLSVGYWISDTVEPLIGRPIDETTGLLVSGVVFAIFYGILWELIIGH